MTLLAILILLALACADDAYEPPAVPEIVVIVAMNPTHAGERP